MIWFTVAFDGNEDLLIMKKMYSINVRGIIQKPVSPKKLAKIVLQLTHLNI